MLPGVVAEAARRFGETIAFVAADGAPLTYAELHERSDALAAGLARRGVGVGEVVVLALPSTPDYVLAYLALAKLGAITAGINPSLAPPEQAALVDLAAPRVVLSPDDLTGLAVKGDAPPRLAPDDDRAVALVFTSGTTGVPKGALFTNRQLAAITAIDLGHAWATTWGGGGPMLASTQFAHVGFMTKLPWYLRLGTTTHLLARWRAADVLKLVAEQGMASIGGISAQIALLLAVPDFDSYDLSSVKTIIVGGGPSSPAMVHEARRTVRRRVLDPLLVDRVGRLRHRHGLRRARRGSAMDRRASARGHRGRDPRRRRTGAWPTARSGKSACARPR